jgi:Zn-finger nucleic acid-binding protein
VFRCERCGGVWVDNAVSQRLVKVYETNIVLAAEDDVARRATTGVNTRPAVACPLCGVALGRVLLRVDGGVGRDACAKHGTWFDRDELPRVVRALTEPEPLEVRTGQNALGENSANAVRHGWRRLLECLAASEYDLLDRVD